MIDEIWSVPTELLDAASAEALRMFVLRQAEKNPLYKGDLIQWLSAAYETPQQRPDSFMIRVRRLFCRVREVEMYRPYHDEMLAVIDWKAVNAGMVELVDELRAALEAGEMSAVPEVVPEFFRLVNEHAGELPKQDYCLLRESHDACAELLNTWQSLPEVPETAKRKLLETVRGVATLRVYKKKMLYSMNKLIISLTALGLPAHEAYRLVDSMKNLDDEQYFVDYHKIRLLYALGREAAAQKLVRRNLTCNLIVDGEVERLISADKLCDAMTLAEAAIEENIYGWRMDALLRKARIAELMNDMPAILDTYEQLAGIEDPSFDAYHKLKKLTPSEEWPRRYRRLVDNLQACGSDTYLAVILAEEGDSERLTDLLMNDDIYNQYNMIHEYLPQLPEKYHRPLLQTCFTTLWKRVPMLKGRGEYAEYAEEVKRFSQLPGSRPYVDELLRRVRTRYARRSALQHELGKV